MFHCGFLILKSIFCQGKESAIFFLQIWIFQQDEWVWCIVFGLVSLNQQTDSVHISKQLSCTLTSLTVAVSSFSPPPHPDCGTSPPVKTSQCKWIILKFIDRVNHNPDILSVSSPIILRPAFWYLEQLCPAFPEEDTQRPIEDVHHVPALRFFLLMKYLVHVKARQHLN